jgi:hypothetical protein
MVQERFLSPKEINLKHFLFFPLLLSLNIASNELLDRFNSLIKKDLSFSQEIETDNNKSFSIGGIVRKDKTIEVLIEKPFKEKYIIKSDEIIVYDFEFNQNQTISISDNEMPLIDLLRVGVKLNNAADFTEKSFQVNYQEKNLYIELISNKSFSVSYADNMNYKNTITFTTTNL